MKLYLVAASALLATTGVAVSAQVTDEAPKAEKKICRTEKMTGSLTRSTRICLTEAQWREVNSRTKKGVDEMQGNASGSQAVNRDAERTGL
jgi:hypothetical protein